MKNFIFVCVGICALGLSFGVSAQVTGLGYKVAVLDSGIMTNTNISSARIAKQFCLSTQDVTTGNSTNATDGFVHYTKASTCRFGSTSDFIRTDAAMVPRVTEHNFNAIYDFHRFASPHGTYVADQVLAMAPNARLLPTNITYYGADREIRVDGTLTQCGVHGPDDTVPDADRPTRENACYGLANPFGNSTLMGRIVSQGNVAAINFSASAEASCFFNNDQFSSITNLGIPILAAAGNGGPGASIRWPACNPNVITVGAGVDLGGGRLASYTSDNGQIDFFAEGGITEYDTLQLSRG